ncbi:MAG: archease [Proteobacteria bacterium]|nr:archease [Pseudomonadota bacterium]
MAPFTLIDHTADLGLEITAAGLPDLYAEAGRALMAVIFDNDPPRKASQGQTLKVTGMDRVDLLVKFLGELLYLTMTRGLAPVDIELEKLTDTRLTARLGLARVDFAENQPAIEIKAVTYHQAAVERTPDGWRARIIFDV